jgi:lysophospholipase L1-like esterase
LEAVGRNRRALRFAFLAVAAALLIWVALSGRGAIETLLRSTLASSEVSDHDRWRIGGIVPKLAALWWRRAGFVAVLAVGGLALAGVARRASNRLALATLALVATATVVLAIELLVAPFLIVPLGLHNYYFVLDVDHRFPGGNAGLGTNADGIRTPREAAEFRAADENIVFLGDSFTYGLGVTAEETFPAVTATLLRERLGRGDVEAANFGWPSSSPLLALRQLEDIGARYQPDVVVFALDMTDFHDDLMYQRMLDRRGLYWWYDKIPITLRTLERRAPSLFDRLYACANAGLPRQRFFATERPLDETRPLLAPVVENLERMARAADRLGADFAVLLLPRAFQYSAEESPDNWEAAQYTVLGPYSREPFRYFESIADRLPFPVFSLLPAFERTAVFPTCLTNDPHWNADGHRVAAEAIADFLAPRIAAAARATAAAEPAVGSDRATAGSRPTWRSRSRPRRDPSARRWR